MSSQRTKGVCNPGRSSTLKACYKASERRTDKDGTWLAHRLVLRLYGHGRTTLWKWSRPPGCPVIGEVLERRPFADEEGRTSNYFSQQQLDRIAQAEASVDAGADANWVTQEDALGTYKLAVSTLYMLVGDGRVRTKKGGRTRLGDGRLSKALTLFSADGLAKYAAEHSDTFRPHKDAISAEKAADILGVSVSSVHIYVRQRRLHATEYAPSGSKIGRLAVWLRRDEVEAEKRRRVTGSRLTPRTDELGWRWLPVALVDKEHGLSSFAVNQHAHVSPSSWCLDGREHFSDYMPAKGSRRPLTWKMAPNVGRPGPVIKVYLEADVQVIADRLAGRLTAKEAADRAREIRAKRARGEGPTGAVRARPAAAPQVPPPHSNIAPPNVASGHVPATTASLEPSPAEPRRRRGQRGPGKETAERRAKIVSEWESGRYESERKLAAALDVSPALVNMVLRDAGVQKKSQP